VNEKTKIIKDGKPAGLGDLAIKDGCKAACLRTSAGLLAIEVRAKTPVPPLARVRGMIASIDLEDSTFKLALADAAGRVMEFYIDGTIIRKDGKPASFGDLKVDDLACVAFVPPPPTTTPTDQPIRAAVVEAMTPPVPIVHVVGKLVRIGEKRVIAVLPPNATAPLLFQVTDDTKIVKLKPAPFEALMVGDTVDVAFRRPAASVIPTALGIMVLPELYRGVIVSVDPLRGLVACQQTQAGAATLGPVILFKVVEETLIVKNGVRVPLTALRPRDLAEVKFFRFRDANVAAAIHAKSPIPPGPR
jgi:hypothetical protein